jgi:hypothetical protein
MSTPIDDLTAYLTAFAEEHEEDAAVLAAVRAALRVREQTIDDTKPLARIEELEAQDWLRKDAVRQTAKEFDLTESDLQRVRSKLRSKLRRKAA